MSARRRVASGAQPERTQLAWDRTTFALAVLAALLTRVVEIPLGLVAAVLTLPAAFALRLLASARYRRSLAAVTTGTLPRRPGLLAATAVVTVILSLACLAVVLAG